jgi:metal-responsive CopG/Arc/MetJ family transcriptional regulator
MRIAVSVPDDVFEAAERLAHPDGLSRSDVYTAAIREYIARHGGDRRVAAVDPSHR